MRLSLLILLAATSLGMAQELKPPAAPSPADRKFGEILLDVRKLAGQEKYDEALAKVNEAQALRPEDPNVFIARGSIYTAMKDYDKARESFTKAISVKPESFGARHNLTELDYVQGHYEKAAGEFTSILDAFPTLPAQTRWLLQFKILVCHLKLGKTAEAAALSRTFAFPDESPPGQFTKASFAFQKGDLPTANAWLEKAKTTFKMGEIVPYLDALVEVRWLQKVAPAAPNK